MSKAKMLVPANLPGVQVPDGYILVQQVKPVPNNASNSMPQPTFGKNWSRNQRKRERMEQLAAGETREPARNPGSVPPPATAETGIKPVVTQPMVQLQLKQGSAQTPVRERRMVTWLVNPQQTIPDTRL